jgi:hypothetical protein
MLDWRFGGVVDDGIVTGKSTLTSYIVNAIVNVSYGLA